MSVSTIGDGLFYLACLFRAAALFLLGCTAAGTTGAAVVAHAFKGFICRCCDDCKKYCAYDKGR